MKEISKPQNEHKKSSLCKKENREICTETKNWLEEKKNIITPRYQQISKTKGAMLIKNIKIKAVEKNEGGKKRTK